MKIKLNTKHKKEGNHIRKIMSKTPNEYENLNNLDQENENGNRRGGTNNENDNPGEKVNINPNRNGKKK